MVYYPGPNKKVTRLNKDSSPSSSPTPTSSSSSSSSKEIPIWLIVLIILAALFIIVGLYWWFDLRITNTKTSYNEVRFFEPPSESPPRRTVTGDSPYNQYRHR